MATHQNGQPAPVSMLDDDGQRTTPLGSLVRENSKFPSSKVSVPATRKLSKRWEDLDDLGLNRSNSGSTATIDWDRSQSMSLLQKQDKEPRLKDLFSVFTDLMKVTKDQDKEKWTDNVMKDIEETRKMHSDAVVARKRAEGQVVELQRNMEKQKSTLISVHTAKQHFASKLAVAEAELEETKAKLAEKERDLEAKERILARAHAQHGTNQELQADYDRMTDLYKQSQEMVGSLETQLKRYVQMLQDLQRDYNKLSEEKASVHSDLTFMKSNLHKKEQMMTTIQLERQNSEREILRVKDELDETRQRFAKKEERLSISCQDLQTQVMTLAEAAHKDALDKEQIFSKWSEAEQKLFKQWEEAESTILQELNDTENRLMEEVIDNRVGAYFPLAVVVICLLISEVESFVL